MRPSRTMQQETELSISQSYGNLSDFERSCLKEFLFFYQMYQDEIKLIVDQEMEQHPILGPIVASIPAPLKEMSSKRSDELMANAIMKGEWDALRKDLEEQSAQMSKLGLSYRSLFKTFEKALHTLEDRLTIHFDNDLAKALPAIRGIRIYLDFILEGYLETQLNIERVQNVRQQEVHNNLKNTQQEFIYVASHNLQEPLSKITGLTEALKDHLEFKDDEGLILMEHLNNTVSDMNRMVMDLLDYSRLGNMSQKAKHNLNLLFREVVDQLVQEGHSLARAIKVGPMPTVVELFPKELKLSISHLLRNAITYRNPKIEFKCEVFCERQEGGWVIHIKDNGKGIASKSVDKIFQLFRREDQSIDIQGTGVGLAICKKTMHLHAGKIWVDSTLGEGTSFHLFFPHRS